MQITEQRIHEAVIDLFAEITCNDDLKPTRQRRDFADKSSMWFMHRILGETLKDIGKNYGICAESARQHIMRIDWIIHRNPERFIELVTDIK